jgi:hypothetical protein
LTDFPVLEESTFVALATHGMAGSMYDVPSGPFEPDEWFHLVVGCRESGLLGLLAAAAQRGDVTLTPAQAEELAVLENEVAGLSLLVEQRVVQLSGLLTAASVGHRLLGGPAIARLGYRQPGVRSFDTAIMLVDLAGLDLATVQRGVHAVPSIPIAPERSVHVSDLSEPPTLLVLMEQPVPTACIEEHLVLACLSVAMTPEPSLLQQRDVAELALFPAIDQSRVQAIAERWGVVEVVAAVLVQVWHLFQLADRTRLSVWSARIADSDPQRDQRATGSNARLGRMLGRRSQKIGRVR